MRVPLEITAAGVVIDGQHRLRAAIELGLTRVPVRVIGPQEDTVEYRGRSACLNGILVWLLGVERLAQRSLSA
jgi:ParB-like chromosome segregation protein Spo0J